MGKLRVGVIFGGRSSEHAISLRSATSVVANLDTSRFEVVPVAITPAGAWRAAARFEALVQDFKLLPGGGDEVFCRPEPGAPALNRADGSPIPLDLFFPVLHGPFGEDGTLQGLLDMKGLPYVGCGVLASAAGMDKDVMKRLFAQAGLPLGRFMTVLRSRWEGQPDAVVAEAAAALGYPIFVKPANMGSSVGVSRATDEAQLRAALTLASTYDRKLILEEAIPGREIELSVLGNDDPVVSQPGEIFIGDTFYSYDDKYSAGSQARYQIPAELDAATVAELQRQARIAFMAIDGAGLARADFFIRARDGQVIINELNTLPGFTSISMYPKMWEASGLPYGDLLTRLVDLALERHADKARNRTD